MSTLNHQCIHCCATTHIEEYDDGDDSYNWISDGVCGCEDDDWDDDD